MSVTSGRPCTSRSGAEPGRADAEDPAEVADQVWLVVETALGGDRGERAAGQDQVAGHVDAAGDQVLMRRHAELGAERAHQVGRVEMQKTRGLLQRNARD